MADDENPFQKIVREAGERMLRTTVPPIRSGAPALRGFLTSGGFFPEPPFAAGSCWREGGGTIPWRRAAIREQDRV